MLTLVPAPFPDECLQSYGCRLLQTNQSKFTSWRSLAKQVCEASGMSMLQLMRHHSPFNYIQFIGTRRQQHEDLSKSEIYINKWARSCNTLDRVAKYCPKCAQEDIDTHGISYWRRIHLLPGVNYCTRHASPLLVVDSSCLVKCQPARAERISSQRYAVSPAEFDAHMSSKVVHRFTLLSEMILNRGVCVQRGSTASTFRNRFNELRQGSLDDLIGRCVQELPKGWISQLLVGKKDRSTISQRIQAHLNPYPQEYTTQLSLLLMAMLWDCPDKALSECIANGELIGAQRTVVMSKALHNDIFAWSAALDGVCV